MAPTRNSYMCLKWVKKKLFWDVEKPWNDSLRWGKPAKMLYSTSAKLQAGTLWTWKQILRYFTPLYQESFEFFFPIDSQKSDIIWDAIVMDTIDWTHLCSQLCAKHFISIISFTQTLFHEMVTTLLYRHGHWDLLRSVTYPVAWTRRLRKQVRRNLKQIAPVDYSTMPQHCRAEQDSGSPVLSLHWVCTSIW